MWPIIAPRVTNYSATQGLGLGLGDQSEQFFDKNCGMAPHPFSVHAASTKFFYRLIISVRRVVLTTDTDIEKVGR